MEGRYLLGVEPAERTAAFLEQVAGDPVDLRELERQTARAQALRKELARQRAAVSEPLVEACPTALLEHLDRVRARPLFGQLFREEPAEFGLVDLSRLVPVQPQVDVSFALSRIPPDPDPARLAEICLPDRPEPLDVYGGVSGDGEAGSFTVYSRDLNLFVSEVKMETQPQLRVSFTITKTAVFTVVVEVGGRLILRNGTHRAVGAALRGVRRLPCLIVHHDGLASLQHHLPPETLLSDCPPYITDFATPGLYLAHPWSRGLKVIRVKADAFVMPLGEAAERGTAMW